MLNPRALGSPNQSLRREIDRLFEDVWGRGGSARSWMPSVDVRESEKAITLEFELPGIRSENIDITSENGVLTVRGEKREERKEGEEEGGRYHVVERSYGEFIRSFQLPPGVDEESIEADFDNGVLTVKVPKSETQSRRISISGARQGAIGGGSSQKQQSGDRERGMERAAEGSRGRGEPIAASGAGNREEARVASGRGGSGARGEPAARGEPRGGESSSRSAPGRGAKNR
jgi:HSP20 family protein